MKSNKKIRVNPRLENWEQVDQALFELGNLTRRKQGYIDRYDAEIEALKTRCQGGLVELLEEMDDLGNQVYMYAVAHIQELEGRSKALTHGAVAFHRSTELRLPKDQSGVIAALKELGKDACLKIVEKVRKAVLKEEAPEIIVAVGGKLVPKDNFRIELPEQVYEYDKKLKAVKNGEDE